MDSATLTVTDGLAVLTLNRPQAANALDLALKTALLDGVRAIAADDTVRAVLIRAEGRNFCVGQDLGEHADALSLSPESAMGTVAEHYNPLIAGITALEVPVVAAVQGACVGAGLGLALAADVVVAAEGATFATAFTAIGLASDSGLTRSLIDAIGAVRTRAFLLLGDRITAAQALDWGLIAQVAPDGEAAATAEAVARRLAAGPTAAFAAAKSLIAASLPPLDEALERERAAAGPLAGTADHRGAVEAFLAKRRPEFTGR
ncbi:enoyl-CoA hydratase/isomerase family protein [Tsukamurella paurometabola]|uniref:Enoyl-CoA hydratase/isomerase family protein n=1 Tax=Tsukamurella paurometabola TaxID=2061 RepID=A0ABS5N7I3_TSUPA|nr:enoyl-CoA hydratase-related protein [Tsukamurella paurometabola]MBS4100213.1 enoyl-CoA hydratase/isomerase family protein [Tsukamurella paurometabola]